VALVFGQVATQHCKRASGEKAFKHRPKCGEKMERTICSLLKSMLMAFMIELMTSAEMLEHAQQRQTMEAKVVHARTLRCCP
jgi:hypothetical protein